MRTPRGPHPAAAAAPPRRSPPGGAGPPEPDARAEYAGRSRRASRVAVHVYRIHRCRLCVLSVVPIHFSVHTRRSGVVARALIKFHSPGRRGVRTGSDVSQRTTVPVRPPTAQRTGNTEVMCVAASRSLAVLIAEHTCNEGFLLRLKCVLCIRDGLRLFLSRRLA